MAFFSCFQCSCRLFQELADDAMKLSRDVRGRFMDHTFEQRGALNEIAAIALSYFEVAEQLGVVRSPVLGFLTRLMELTLRLKKGQLWVDWPTARPTLGGSHVAP